MNLGSPYYEEKRIILLKKKKRILEKWGEKFMQNT